MIRLLTGSTFLLVILLLATPMEADEKKEPPKKDPPRQGPPFMPDLLRGTPDEFLKKLDRNGDGSLTRSELPPMMAFGFDRADRNNDGKLDAKEVAEWLPLLKQRMGPGGLPMPPGFGNPDAMAASMLERLDSNKDGKISKDEARGPLQDSFARLDTNGDGFLDKEELRRSAARFAGAPGGSPQGPDFDSLDQNADGRLTREELKGSPYGDRFDEIDTSKDGKIDAKEFAAYLKSARPRGNR